MKTFITKFAVLVAIIAVSLTACEKAPLQEVGESYTTLGYLGDGKELTISNGSLNFLPIIGERIVPGKIIPKLDVYYLNNKSERVLLTTYSNVSLSENSPNPFSFKYLGEIYKPLDKVWSFKLSFPLSSLGTGVGTTRATTIILVVSGQDGKSVSEFHINMDNYGLKL